MNFKVRASRFEELKYSIMARLRTHPLVFLIYVISLVVSVDQSLIIPLKRNLQSRNSAFSFKFC
jgi:hypothetical protein